MKYPCLSPKYRPADIWLVFYLCCVRAISPQSYHIMLPLLYSLYFLLAPEMSALQVYFRLVLAGTLQYCKCKRCYPVWLEGCQYTGLRLLLIMFLFLKLNYSYITIFFCTPCPQHAPVAPSICPKQASYPSGVGILPHLTHGRDSSSMSTSLSAYLHALLIYTILCPRYCPVIISPPLSLPLLR